MIHHHLSNSDHPIARAVGIVFIVVITALALWMIWAAPFRSRHCKSQPLAPVVERLAEPWPDSTVTTTTVDTQGGVTTVVEHTKYHH